MSTDPLTTLLGETLLSKEGSVSTKDALAGKKAIALYFSAHWCPPCRGFTPQLAQGYSAHLKAKGLEVVFVSSDRDEESFKEYFGEMPWLALPYEARDLKNSLSKKYKVRGIPSLVVIDGAGETITTDGRAAFTEDPTGDQLPWKPPTFWEALGDEFLEGSEGDTVSADELKARAKVIGLYFSAHWCPPCRGFTPELVKAYTEHLKAKGLEIIFVSSDKSPAEFGEYFGEMPWLAIPAGDKRKDALSKVFGVEGIPTFALVDATTGETITKNARNNVSRDPTGESFPWYPPAVSDLSVGEGIESLEDELSLVVLLSGCDEATKAAAKAALTPIAEAAKANKQDTAFFLAPTDDGPVGQVRKLTKLEKIGGPQMLLLDIPDQGGYYVSPATEVTAETIVAFLEGYKAKALERKQLG